MAEEADPENLLEFQRFLILYKRYQGQRNIPD
jgi:hypothetical protein